MKFTSLDGLRDFGFGGKFFIFWMNKSKKKKKAKTITRLIYTRGLEEI